MSSGGHPGIARAAVLVDLGRAERGLEQARQALASDPDDARSWFSAARALIAMDEWEDALHHAREGLAREPVSGWGLRLASVCLSALGRAEESLDCARRARAAEPDAARSVTRLARCLWHLGEPEEAEGILEAFSGEPTPGLLMLRAELSRGLGDTAAAVTHARAAMVLDPQWVPAMLALGRALYADAQSSDAEAFAVMSRACTRDPTRDDLREETARIGFVVVDLPVLVVLALLSPAWIGAMLLMGWARVCPALGLFGLVATALYATRRRGLRRLDEAMQGGGDRYHALWGRR